MLSACRALPGNSMHSFRQFYTKHYEQQNDKDDGPFGENIRANALTTGIEKGEELALHFLGDYLRDWKDS